MITAGNGITPDVPWKTCGLFYDEDVRIWTQAPAKIEVEKVAESQSDKGGTGEYPCRFPALSL